MKYAIVQGGVVVNIAEANAPIDTNWIQSDGAGVGWSYANGVFSAAPAPTPLPDPCQWLIDKGPFMDRFSTAKLAVLTSTDVTVKAIVQETLARQWIDLKRADVAQSLAYIGSVVASVTPTLQSAILNTPVAAAENLALRKLFFA